ncbi:MAG: TonB-dependent receptor, partial [Nodosilinea sp.]
AMTLVGSVSRADGVALGDDVVVTLTSSAGEFIGADYNSDRSGFQVLARQGQFEAQLRSAIDAQTVTVRAAVDSRSLREIDPALRENYPNLEATAQVSFVTDLRPTIISGVVDFRVGRGGTNFLGSFSDFLSPDSLNQDVEVGFTAGLFATGAVGDWLFTGAYNNTRGLNDRCDGSNLYRDVQACEQTYPVYGDSSTTDSLASSIDSLYLRFQRDSLAPDAGPDYFMWGDYGTQEFAGESQQFTAAVRELHGFKGNYTFGNGLQLTALYGDNVRPFQRDTIAPDGTSGYYFLSRRLVLRGSENVFLEVEEFNRPGTVLERTPLYRGADYDIDYDRGTLLFKQPVRAVDLNPLGTTLVRRIVVTYQVDDASVRGSLYAGRLQYRPGGDDGGLVGATLLTENQGAQDFTLYGFDVLLPLGEQGRITGEFARSSFNAGAINNQGNAYRVELSGTPFDGLSGQAYYRSTDSGFNNTATSSFRPGQTRWGAQVLAQVGAQTQLRALIDQERNVGNAVAVPTTAAALLRPGQNPTLGGVVDNTLTELRAGVVQQIGSATLGVDFVNRSREERLTNFSTDASQLVSRLNLPLTDTLSALAQSELSLGTTDPLYPTRNTVGLEWAVQPGVSVRLSQQFLSGVQGPSSITSLDTLVDYELDDNTTLTNRYSLLGGYNGITGQGAIGLNHRLALAPGLRATFGFERIFGDAFNLTAAGQQFAQPFAVGQGASALGLQASTVYSVGLEYTDNPDWQASGRVEYRDSPGSNNLVLGAAGAGRITDSLTGLARFDLGNFANQTITDQLGNSSSLRLGLAYRNPVSDQFNGLLSYEFRNNPSSTPDSILIGTRSEAQDHTLQMEGIYAPNYRWEFYGKYGLRYSTANLAQNFGFSNSIHLAQLRATYRFAYRWDVGAEVRYLGQPTVGYNETGFALEAGYYLTPDVRLGLGYSFGGASDGSFVGGGGYRSASGPYFGITAKVNQLFNGFGVQPVSPPQQQDSYVDESALIDRPDLTGTVPGGEE